MKRIVSLLILLTILLFILPLNITATEYESSIDSVLISQDGASLSVKCTVPQHSKSNYYLFRVFPNDESITNLTPISESVQENGNVIFTVNYDANDHSLALYGYVLAISNGSNGYTKLTNAAYIDNLSDFSHNNTLYTAPNTKKGLEVQYLTDAQILGIGHTVVHVYLNDLISTNEENSIPYVYGDLKYYLNKDVIDLLDYRIKTLTEAGINVYINFLLAFDTDAYTSLYYPNAKGGNGTLFAVNISTHDSVNLYASAIHYVAERYTCGEFGFCGRYIIGYEVNNENESNSAGIASLNDYVKEYGKLLRTSHLALSSAYSNVRLYASLSNHWTVPSAEIKSEYFGAKEFIDKLLTEYSDIPFGIAINPYPSTLTQTDFWNDPKATDSIETEYVTMKNISVLTEYINNFEISNKNIARPILISEFGVSGQADGPSEPVQAAAYAYAYYKVENDPYIEAFIWHRHVDHVSEINLNYGIFSSTDIIIDANKPKLIHEIIKAVDDLSTKSITQIKDLIQYLPIESYEELIGNFVPNRKTINIDPISSELNSSSIKKQILYDFSKNLYSFYPTDNAEYIDLIKDCNVGYMRIASLMTSDIEYIGAGAFLSDINNILGADYLSITLRVNSEYDISDFALVLSDGINKSNLIMFNSSVKNNEWVTLTFPLKDLKEINFDNAALKIWIRSNNSENEQIYIDISSIDVINSVNNTASVILTIIVSAAIACTITATIILLINRYRTNK